MTDWLNVGESIATATGVQIGSISPEAIGGGCINETWQLGEGANRYFVKINGAKLLSMFEAEKEGLEEILGTNTVRAPRPICCGVAGDSAFLVLEFIEFGGGANGLLGRQLAEMHRCLGRCFGWRRDNTIGSTPQLNSESDHWVEFLRERRLGFQLALAAERGYGGTLQRDGARLMEKLGGFYTDYRPVPSLLHGDLWGGNCASDIQGQPVIYDPAVYYGDREFDMAMTELFGGFGQDFYAAYNEVWALDQGYRVRKTLYNLYHILNHLNLFGGGYLSQAERMLGRLLSETN